MKKLWEFIYEETGPDGIMMLIIILAFLGILIVWGINQG